jgi:hypothetical protein
MLSIWDNKIRFHKSGGKQPVFGAMDMDYFGRLSGSIPG